MCFGGVTMSDEFDALMAGMGVKRAGDDEGPVPPRKVVRRKAGQTTAAALAAANPSTIEARVVELERAVDFIKGEREEAQAAVSTLKSRVKKLKASLSAAEAAVSATLPTIAEVLSNWGFETADDRAALLMLDGMLERVIGATDLGADLALRDELKQSLVRVCSGCRAPKGRLVLSVAPAACTVCGGFDINREARRFVDAALINGRLRVVIVGRDTEHHRWVRERIGHKRLVLTHVPGSVRREAGAAQTAVDHADAVVIWDPASIDPEHLAIYRSSARVGEVDAGSMGAFLSAAAAIIAAD
jgi:hypothetical protein